MTIHDEQQPGPGGRARRRAGVVAGVVGVAAVLGGGAYFVTDKLTERRAVPAEVGALAPQPGTIDPTGEPTPSASAASASPAKPKASPSASMVGPVVPKEVRERIDAARKKMAKDGVKIQRPRPVSAAVAPVVDLDRSTVGTLKTGGVVRLVTARSDLTGQEELRWVTDEDITRHGDSQCTQTVRLSSNPTAVKKPNLLMCWRTSATKSVVAILVDPDGDPSSERATEALDEKWRSMG